MKKMKNIEKKLKNQKRISINIETDTNRILGKLCREDHLEFNPHGFRRVNKIHKNKKKYNRKRFNKSIWL